MQKAFLLQSGGESGKSVFLDLLTNFLGSQNVSSEGLQDLGNNRFRAANLVDKLANLCADISKEAVDDSGVFKKLVTGDKMPAERKHKDTFDFGNKARLIFSCNELPRTKDTTHGYFRRWVILIFPNSFPDGDPRRDPYLIEKLTTPEELSGLLNIAIRGLKRLMNRGSFSIPESATSALNKYILDNDSVKAFCDDCVTITQHYRVRRGDLYRYYKNYCAINGLHEVGSRKFCDKIRDVFPDVEEITSNGRWWKNISAIDPVIRL